MAKNWLVHYGYDAFGEEILGYIDNTGNNFKYCGEYFDAESGSYYLRARYYQPSIGRFTTADPHWNTGNMIYGDNPVKINERKNPYNPHNPEVFAYMPDISAVVQSGNLYGYCGHSPTNYTDFSGELYPSEIHNLVVNKVAYENGFYKEQRINYSDGKYGRADLISPDGKVWDVKRDDSAQIAAGVKQVEKYVANKWNEHENTKLSVGGYIKSGSFTYTTGFDIYHVTYSYAGNGIIAYDYTYEFNSEAALAALAIAALWGLAIVVTDGAALALAFA